MPGYDGTGPRGAGPMSGRAGGLCNTSSRSFGNQSSRPKFGMGRGHGFRNMFHDTGLCRWMRWAQPGNWSRQAAGTGPKEQEEGFLKDQAEMLQSELNAIQDRLSKLEFGDDRAS